jgi:hypothetical protein
MPPSPRCEMSVIVPARDEGAVIEETLRALACQTDWHGVAVPPWRYEVIVLANNCVDDTAARAREFARRHPAAIIHVAELDLPECDAHIGWARRLLMDEACRRLSSLGKPGRVIASTDADTRVDRRWVAGLLAEFAAGADAVGGRIVVEPDELARLHPGARHFHLRDVGYRFLASELDGLLDPVPHDPWPRHFQHFGPSIAVTARAYAAVGGLPVRPSLEDVALYDALVLRDARIRHSPWVRVTTSARGQGRTEFGFAVQLAQWQRMSEDRQPFLVSSGWEIEAAALVRRELREAWRNAASGVLDRHAVANLAVHVGIEARWLMEHLRMASTFGCLMHTVGEQQEAAGEWRARWPMQEIRQAIGELRLRLAGAHGRNGSVTLRQQIEPVGLAAELPDVA